MADPNAARDREEFLRQAAEETREPEAARRMRVADEDSGDARSRRDDGMALRETADSLAETRERLRDTGSGLQKREQELERTGALARDLAQRAAELRADTAQTIEAARDIPVPLEQPGED